MKKQVKIWDTYVTKRNGSLMHFDIVAPNEVLDPEKIYAFGKAYLKSKGQEGLTLSAQECKFCHIEDLHPEWEELINTQGYFIIEMEGC